MTGVSLTNATISSATIKQGSKISNLTIHSGAMIERVMTTPGGVVANTYKITEGTISGSITVDPDSKIATGAVIATTTDANISAINITSSSLTLPGVAGAAKKSETTIKRDRSLTTATEGIPISTPILLTRYSVANFTYLSSKTYTFSSGPSRIQIGEDETSTTVAIPVDIAGVPIQSLTSTNISITGTFQNLAGPATTPKSFYEQNIYYIFNFIKMIKYIDKASFSTTSKYLHIYILCYKSLLLASIRAANIFYNNRHRLNAVAISYETNFLNNTPEASGGSGCAKKSLNDFVKNDKKADFSSTSTCTSTEALPANTYMGGDGFKYILYKPNGGSDDNNAMFKAYDMRILEEFDNLSNTKVKESTANLGITNFQIFSSFVLKGKFTITSYD